MSVRSVDVPEVGDTGKTHLLVISSGKMFGQLYPPVEAFLITIVDSGLYCTKDSIQVPFDSFGDCFE